MKWIEIGDESEDPNSSVLWHVELQLIKSFPNEERSANWREKRTKVLVKRVHRKPRPIVELFYFFSAAIIYLSLSRSGTFSSSNKNQFLSQKWRGEWFASRLFNSKWSSLPEYLIEQPTTSCFDLPASFEFYA